MNKISCFFIISILVLFVACNNKKDVKTLPEKVFYQENYEKYYNLPDSCFNISVKYNFRDLVSHKIYQYNDTKITAKYIFKSINTSNDEHFIYLQTRIDDYSYIIVIRDARRYEENILKKCYFIKWKSDLGNSDIKDKDTIITNLNPQYIKQIFMGYNGTIITLNPKKINIDVANLFESKRVFEFNKKYLKKSSIDSVRKYIIKMLTEK
jgi:hypothetical protein